MWSTPWPLQKRICISFAAWMLKDGNGGNTGGGEGPTPPHEHSFGGWKNDGTNHWKECSCGEKSEESPHNFGEWELIYYDVNTKYDVCERQCLTCGYEQIDQYREHQHYYTPTTGVAVRLHTGRYATTAKKLIKIL